jgi:hypothetical protein
MIDRRRFLQLGAAGVLTGGLRESVLAQQARPEPRKVKSVIWLWMGGGPSQLDTWDPKPDSVNGGGLRAIDTTVPGIRISELLPVCASQMERLTLIRSVATTVRDHEPATSLLHCGVFPTCWDTDVSLGSILAYELWNRGSGSPPFVAIDAPPIPEAADLGRDFLPLHLRQSLPEASRVPGADLQALLDAQVQEWAESRAQEGANRIAEARARLEKWRASSWERALTLDEEPEALKRAYGGRFGQNCLRARRLVQADVAVVEIGLHGWDTHEHHALRTRKLCRSLDAGLGTLVRDLAEKDLLKDTVVLCLGEFGRSPTLDRTGGRDHWTDGFSAVTAGGALAGGRVRGDTGEDGLGCVKPVPVHDLFATLFQACGVNFNKSYNREGRKTKYVSQNGNTATSGTPVRELF